MRPRISVTAPIGSCPITFNIASVVLFLATLSPIAQAVSQSTLDLTSVHACTEPEATAWLDVKNSLEMAGLDIFGHKIGGSHGSDKWFPHSSYKETVCGQLNEFKAYVTSDGDGDWAFNLVPYPPYDAMLAAAEDAGGIAVCDGACIHSEIQPDGSFPDDDFFRVVTHNSAHQESDLVGSNMCVYGPWIRDAGHDDKPEIHPAEIVWWRQPKPAAVDYRFAGRPWLTTQTYHAMFLQDDRNSFDRVSDFSGPGIVATIFGMPVYDTPPTAFIPWAKVPRLSELRIAFEVDVTGAKLVTYGIHERYSRWVVTPDDPFARRDEGAGTESWIKLNNIQVLKVQEYQPDDNLGVLFEGLCVGPTTNSLRGYIVLRTRYGGGDRGGEGYQVLDIARIETNLRLQTLLDWLQQHGGTASQFTDSAVAEVLARLRFHPPLDSLAPNPRFEFRAPLRRINGQLVGDVVAEVELENPTAPTPRAARLYTRAGATNLRVESMPEPSRLEASTRNLIVIRGVPVLAGDSVRIEMPRQRYVVLSRPELGMTADLLTMRPLQGRAAPEARNNFLSYAGAAVTSLPPGIDLVFSRDWRAELIPRYAPKNEEGIAPEEQLPITRWLNSVVDSSATARNDARLRAIYGVPNPISVSWTFSASNRTTGAPLTVETGRTGSATAVHVDTSAVQGTALGFTVRFPESRGEIYELVATGTLKDSYGIRGSVKQSVWSHLLKADDASGVQTLRLVGQVAGFNPSDLNYVTQFLTDSSSNRPAAMTQKRAFGSVLAKASYDAASDQRVSPAEFRRLMHVAKGFGIKRR